MADFNKPKKPPLSNSGSSSASAPSLAPKQNAKPLTGAKIQPGSPYKSESVPVGVQQGKFESPKHVNKRVDKMFGETKQPTLGVWNKDNKHPMAKPNQVKFNPELNYKPTQEQLQAANRKKIMQAGFAPRQNASELSNVSKNVDRDSAIKKAHDGLYNSGQLDLSGNTITKNNVQRIQKELGEDYPEDEIIGWMENNSSFRKPTNYGEEQEEAWNNEDNPGSAVTSGRLMDYVRKTLSKDPELSPEFIDKTVKGLYQNSNQADYYKGKMKEDWERRKASKLYGTDLVEDVQPATSEEVAKWKAEDDKRDDQLMKKYGWDVLPVGSENMSEEEIVNEMNKGNGLNNEQQEREKASQLYGTDLNKKPSWPRDKNYQEPEGFKSEEWANADLKQKSDEDLIKMHDNLSKKLWHLQYRSPEEEALQSKIEREYLRRHPVNLDDE